MANGIGHGLIAAGIFVAILVGVQTKTAEHSKILSRDKVLDVANSALQSKEANKNFNTPPNIEQFVSAFEACGSGQVKERNLRDGDFRGSSDTFEKYGAAYEREGCGIKHFLVTVNANDANPDFVRE